MTLEELVKRFHFHDSYAESIRWSEAEKKLVFELELSNWFQPETESRDENFFIVQLVFHEVDFSECMIPECVADFEIYSVALLRRECGKSGIEFYLFNDWTQEDQTLKIYAASADVVGLG